MRIFIAIISVFFTICLFGQLPSTDVYSFDIKTINPIYYEFSNGLFLNSFNKNGYNNQPYIGSDGLIYISSSDKNNQTDILSLDLKTKKVSRITQTLDESEYSPVYISNNNKVSYVKVENDGNKTQRIWATNLSDGNSSIYLDKKEVGYYHFFETNKALLYLIGDRSKLMLFDKGTEKGKVILDNIGRGFRSDSKGLVYFIHKFNDKTWFIKSYNSKTGELKSVCPTVPMSEDFCFNDKGTLFMGSGSKLFALPMPYTKKWIEVADFKPLGINKITRLDIRKNKLVFVNKKN